MEEWQFTDEDELLLQQLLVKKEWAEKSTNGTREEASPVEPKTAKFPQTWKLNGAIQLYPWQKACRDRWFENNGSGTVKVVTGAGKTIFALGIIETLQKDLEPDLHVAIVVPTVVLMHQWYDEIAKNTNIPLQLIGRLGDNFSDTFDGRKKILICVINSAQKKLADIANQAHCGEKLILIVDECHRAGAPTLRKVLETPRKYSLGLSATPERENDNEDLDEGIDDQCTRKCQDETDYDETLLGKALGPIIFEMTLQDAFKSGIIPPYEIRHYGLSLSPQERSEYEGLTREIRDARKKLLQSAHSHGVFSERTFQQWCKRENAGDKNTLSLKRVYLQKAHQRKALLYRSKSRHLAVFTLLKQEFESNKNAKAILFHENIDEVMEIWRFLQSENNSFVNLKPVPEHSKLSDARRKESIELFRKGAANVLVSVKAQVEGFNVPAVDVGIVVASSTSVRQRIQTLGRLLRKHKSKDGIEKSSVIHVLYSADTVDERIYEKADWGSLTGDERNTYFLWDVVADEEPKVQDGPPRHPLPSDTEIEEVAPEIGEEYPGKYEGIEYSVDSDGNVYLGGEREKPVVNPQGISNCILTIKGSYGRFRVTPVKQFVLVRVSQGNEWKTLYVTRLEEPFITAEKPSQNVIDVDMLNAQPGDQIPLELVSIAEEYGFKKKGGREIISKKVNRGEDFALTTESAQDPQSGEQAEDLIRALVKTEKILNERIPRFKISKNIAYTLKDGKAFFITKLDHPLEFLK